MGKRFGKKLAKVLLVSAYVALLAEESVFAASKKNANQLVKEEEGFFYGYGKASTKEEAEFIAKKDLIETALTVNAKKNNPKIARISISDEIVKKRLPNIKVTAKDKAGTDVYYKIKVTEWDKDEVKFAEELRSTLNPFYTKLNSNEGTAEKINSAVEILNELSSSGERELLTLTSDGNELYSRVVEQKVEKILENLKIELSMKDGFVGPESKFSVSVKDDKGKAIGGLNLKAIWEVADIGLVSENGTIPEAISSKIITSKDGIATIEYPSSSEFKNTCVTLTVTTLFSDTKFSYAALRKFDAKTSVDGRYVYYDDKAEAFKGVAVNGGEFNAGKVSQDRKAGSKEAVHTVTIDSFEIDIAPVTNAQYGAFVFITRTEEYPQYFDNTDYNLTTQPVIGISYEQAEAYAAWLSEQTGFEYRLPNADEWEMAARAGNEFIYPWGDEAPNVGKSANYKGNGKFKSTSPVGSFANGTNAWGLVDMSGNVWEWTSSAINAAEDSTDHTVKGGSFMDGPSDLRVSNFKNVDGTNGYVDVGFRLVKSVLGK